MVDAVGKLGLGARHHGSGVERSQPMSRPLRARASLITAFTTVIGMAVYQHDSREPPSDAYVPAARSLPGLDRNACLWFL